MWIGIRVARRSKGLVSIDINHKLFFKRQIQLNKVHATIAGIVDAVANIADVVVGAWRV